MPWRKAMTLEAWAEKVLAHRSDVLGDDGETLQSKFVGAVRDHPLYGTHFFYIRYGLAGLQALRACSARALACERRWCVSPCVQQTQLPRVHGIVPRRGHCCIQQ